MTRAAALWPEARRAVGAPRRRSLAGAGAPHLRGAGRRRPPGRERARRISGSSAATPSRSSSVNCAELVPLLLAAEAVGIFAPINPALAAEHATELVRLAGARVIVAAGPGARPRRLGARPRRSRRRPGRARCWPCARPRRTDRRPRSRRSARRRSPTSTSGWPAPTRRRCRARRRRRPTSRATCTPAARPARPKLAARTHANEVANAWMITCPRSVPARQHLVRRAAAVPHKRAARDRARAAAQGPARGVGRTARLSRPCPVRELLEDRRALPDRGHVRSSDGLRRPRADPRRRGHLEPGAPDRRSGPAAARGARRVRGAYRRPALRGLRPHRGHVRERDQPPRRAAQRNGRSAAAIPGGARGRDRRDDRGVDIPARRRSRDDRPARAQRVRRLSRPRRVRDRAARGRQAPRRLARHRRSRSGRRGRLHRPRRPRQGPHHPRGAQHRSRHDRGRAAGAPGGRRPRLRSAGPTSTPARCRWRSSSLADGASVERGRARAPGRPTASPSAPPRPSTSRSSTRSRTPRSASPTSRSCGAGQRSTPPRTRWPGHRCTTSCTSDLVDGAIEILVPRSSDDETVHAALSSYAWSWRFV